MAARARFGVFAVLNALLDQNRMEKWHERRSDRSGRFRGVFDLELARVSALAYDRLQDRQRPGSHRRRVQPGEAFLDSIGIVGIARHYGADLVKALNLRSTERPSDGAEIVAQLRFIASANDH